MADMIVHVEDFPMECPTPLDHRIASYGSQRFRKER